MSLGLFTFLWHKITKDVWVTMYHLIEFVLDWTRRWVFSSLLKTFYYQNAYIRCLFPEECIWVWLEWMKFLESHPRNCKSKVSALWAHQRPFIYLRGVSGPPEKSNSLPWDSVVENVQYKKYTSSFKSLVKLNNQLLSIFGLLQFFSSQKSKVSNLPTATIHTECAFSSAIS